MAEYIVTEHPNFPYEEPKPPELVRCKYCKHFQYAIRSNGWGECDLGVFGRHFVEDEWYCSMAERMNGGEE